MTKINCIQRVTSQTHTQDIEFFPITPDVYVLKTIRTNVEEIRMGQEIIKAETSINEIQGIMDKEKFDERVAKGLLPNANTHCVIMSDKQLEIAKKWGYSVFEILSRNVDIQYDEAEISTFESFNIPGVGRCMDTMNRTFDHLKNNPELVNNLVKIEANSLFNVHGNVIYCLKDHRRRVRKS